MFLQVIARLVDPIRSTALARACARLRVTGPNNRSTRPRGAGRFDLAAGGTGSDAEIASGDGPVEASIGVLGAAVRRPGRECTGGKLITSQPFWRPIGPQGRVCDAAGWFPPRSDLRTAYGQIEPHFANSTGPLTLGSNLRHANF